MRRASRVLLIAGLLLSCGERRLPPLPVAPRLDAPAQAMPGDLDLVIRLDLERLRAGLGPAAATAIELLLRTPSDEPDAATGRLLLALFARARTAWIGVRPGLDAELTDNVIVLRGDFASVVPNTLSGEPRWQAPRDLGGGVRRFERAAPKARAAPAVIYAFGSDVVVVGSYAEIDALERTLEAGRGDPAVPAPEAGVVSLGARLTGLRARLVERAPSLGRLAAGAERLEARAELTEGRLELRFDVAYDSAVTAEAVARALGALARALASPERPWLGNAKIEPIGRFVTLRTALAEGEVLRLLVCSTQPGCDSGGTVAPP